MTCEHGAAMTEKEVRHLSNCLSGRHDTTSSCFDGKPFSIDIDVQMEIERLPSATVFTKLERQGTLQRHEKP
jgi:hypothetical protein